MIQIGHYIPCPSCGAQLIVLNKVDWSTDYNHCVLVGHHFQTPKNPNNVVCEQVKSLQCDSLTELHDALVEIKKPTPHIYKLKNEPL